MSQPITCGGWHYTGMWIKSRNRNIAIRGESRAHTTSLTPSHFIEGSVPNPESKQSLYVV